MDLRPNPLRWDPSEEEPPEGVFLGEPDSAAEPRLLGMPEGLRTAPPRPGLRDAGDAAAREIAPILAAAREAMLSRRPGDAPAVLDLAALSDPARRALDELLGEGEVSAIVSGRVAREVRETVLTGLWRVRSTDASGALLADELEVAEVPEAILLAAERGPRAEVPEPAPAQGTMNAPALLAEIRARAAAWAPGEENHVISFTLLPVTEADMALLRGTLGTGPVLGVSRGYGHVRVQLTGCRRVWSVQFLNARDAIVLDTLEIGGVPATLRAEREDFEDSAVRLAEMLGA